jgi:hypothetical protein
MRASSTDGSKGQKVLNTCLVWDFSGTRSGPVTAAVAGFSSAAWPEFGPPYTNSPFQTAMIGIHYPLYRTPSSRHMLRLKELVGPLGRAAHLRTELRSLGWKSSVAVRALDQLASGMVVTDVDARVIELNRAAGSLLECADGLAVCGGRLCAARAFENAKLMQLIAAASAEQSTPGTVRRMMIVRRDGRLPLAVAVMPLGASLALFDRPLTLIMIVAPGRAAALAPGPCRPLRPVAGREPARGGACRR